MELPSVEHFLVLGRRRGLNVEASSTSFFLSRRVLRPTSRSSMSFWQEKLFIWLADTSEDATAYFQFLLTAWSRLARRSQSDDRYPID